MLAEVRCSLRVSDVVASCRRPSSATASTRLGLSPSRVLLRPNGFPDGLLAQPTSDPDAPLRLATIGRWERLKGSDELPAVLAGFLRAVPGSTALLLGTGVSAAQVLADLPADIRARVEVLPLTPRRRSASTCRGVTSTCPCPTPKGSPWALSRRWRAVWCRWSPPWERLPTS